MTSPTTDITSPVKLAERCRQRAQKQNDRIQEYQLLYTQYKGIQGGNTGGGVKGSYPDGRPALQELEGFHSGLQARKGAPNWSRPIIDDRVAVTSDLPVVTFDAPGDEQSDVDKSVLASRAVRGQYKLSQMEVGMVEARFFSTLYGAAAFTLDPLRPSDVKAMKNPFKTPGVYINVHDPTFAFPRFGTGDERNRAQDMFLYYKDLTREEVESYSPEEVRKLKTTEGNDAKYELIVFYTDDYKTILVANGGSDARQIYRDDHHYGFCTAEWGLNKLDGGSFGVSEIDQTYEQNKTTQALFHLAMDGAIIATFPPIHVHNAEHVGRMTYGPMSVIETSEDGAVTPLSSTVNIQVPAQLLDISRGNMLMQTGTSPLRQDQEIRHANTSGRAIASVQAPGQARIDMSNTLMGSALESLNAKIARILYQDKQFNKTEMTIYGVSDKGSRKSVTFKGEDLDGIWHNHVQWGTEGGDNKHEVLVMYLQLYKEGLVSGRKVLEVIGEEDPEKLIQEAHLDQQQKATLMQAMQGGQPGDPGMAQQGVALGAGAMPGGGAVPGGQVPQPGVQPMPPPPPGAGMPGFSPISASPAGPPGAAAPVPDINSEVQLAAAELKLHGEILGATTMGEAGIPTAILLYITSHKDIAMLKTALRPLAETLLGPNATIVTRVRENVIP